MSLFDEGELDPDDPLVRARMMAALEQQNAPERDLALTMKTGASTRPWRKPHREQFDRREPVHFFDVAGHTIRYTDEASLGHSGEIAKTGRLVWDAALVLCKFYESERHFGANARFWRGRSVVELGAGLGLPSLAAAHCGAARVVMSDLADALELPRANIALNAAAVPGTVSAVGLDWGDTTRNGGTTPLGQDWDVVLLTDVLFVPAAIPPLVETIDSLCGPATRVLSCCEHRFPGATSFYEQMERRGFEVVRVPNEHLHDLYRGDVFHVYWMHRRGPATGSSDAPL